MAAEKTGWNYAISHEELLKHIGKRPLTEKEKEGIRSTVNRVMSEYGETIRMLAKE